MILRLGRRSAYFVTAGIGNAHGLERQGVHHPFPAPVVRTGIAGTCRWLARYLTELRRLSMAGSTLAFRRSSPARRKIESVMVRTYQTIG